MDITNFPEYRTSIGQDSHAFEDICSNKKLILGGIVFESLPALHANSDGDVILHAITNAISGITGVNILGKIADELCINGITDSSVYLNKALEHLVNYSIVNISISIECSRPKIMPRIVDLKNNISHLLNLEHSRIGITATTGEGLTSFGQGKGIQVLCIMTVVSRVK